MLETAKQGWFHGDIDQSTAEDRIRANKVNGSFLVRFSSKPGMFTISQTSKQGGDIEHRRIQHSPGNPYVFGRVSAPTLPGLISLIAESLGLRHPCAGSRFTRIFEQNQRSGGYVQSSGYMRSSMDDY